MQIFKKIKMFLVAKKKKKNQCMKTGHLKNMLSYLEHCIVQYCEFNKNRFCIHFAWCNNKHM